MSGSRWTMKIFHISSLPDRPAPWTHNSSIPRSSAISKPHLHDQAEPKILHDHQLAGAHIDSVFIDAPLSFGFPYLPIREVAPKRRLVYIWACCSCGCSSINIRLDTCPDCNTARCAFCQTSKVQVR